AGRHGRPRVIPRRIRDAHQFSRPAVENAAEQDVVTSLFVTVPCDPDPAGSVDCDRRLPVIRDALADPDFLGPTLSVKGFQINVRLTRAKAHPDESESAVAVTRQIMKDIRPRIVGESHPGRFPSPFDRASLQFPVSVLLLRPDYPEPALPILSQRGAKKIAPLRRDSHRFGPAVVAARAQKDFIPQVFVPDPRNPDSSFAPDGHRNMIIFPFGCRQELSDRLSLDERRAAEKTKRFAVHQVF